MPDTPNLFLVGAARAGTTTLWTVLRQHPEIFMPADALRKEPAYFSTKGRGMPLDTYLALFPTAPNRYRWVGEASTAYLSDPDAAGRISRFSPAARILIVLRDPAERAYSLYNWMAQEGYETASSFERALALEPRRARRGGRHWSTPEYRWNYRYVGSGRYSGQVDRYLARFGPRVLLLCFERLRTDPQAVFDRVCRFLDVPSLPVAPVLTNRSRAVYHPWLQFALRKATTARSGFYRRVLARPLTTKAQRDRWMRLGWRRTAVPPLPAETRRRLTVAFRPDLIRLSRRTGFDVRPWIHTAPRN